MTEKERQQCDLCRLPLELKSFSLKTKSGEHFFCCEGCKVIYQMLFEQAILPEDEKKLP